MATLKLKGMSLVGLGLIVAGVLGVMFFSSPLSAQLTPDEQKIAREKAAQRLPTDEQAPPVGKPQFPRVETQPDWAKKIAAIPERGFASHPILRGSTSVWQVDSIPNGDYTDWNPLIVYTKPGTNGHPTLSMLVMNMPADPMWTGQWTSPQAIGSISITSISGQKGVLYFRSEAGQVGSFDLVTHTWSFGQ